MTALVGYCLLHCFRPETNVPGQIELRHSIAVHLLVLGLPELGPSKCNSSIIRFGSHWGSAITQPPQTQSCHRCSRLHLNLSFLPQMFVQRMSSMFKYEGICTYRSDQGLKLGSATLPRALHCGQGCGCIVWQYWLRPCCRLAMPFLSTCRSRPLICKSAPAILSL